jgi:hypothetical protein
MSEVFVVIPTFDAPNAVSLINSIEGLKDFSKDKEFLRSALQWNAMTLRWSREDVKWQSTCLAFDVKRGVAPDTEHLGYCLGMAVLRGRYGLECERLLALS